MKWQATDQKSIFAKDSSDKGSKNTSNAIRIQRTLKTQRLKKFKNRPKTSYTPHQKKRQKSIWKDAPHRMSSETWKLKWDTTIHLLKWPRSRTCTIPTSGKDVEQQVLTHCCWQYKTVQPLWKTIWQLLTKINILLPHKPAKTLFGI